MLSVAAQDELVEALENKLDIDSRIDVRLRLVAEFALSAWRSGAKKWVAGRGFDGRRGHGGIDMLVRRVEEAFDAIDDAVALSA